MSGSCRWSKRRAAEMGLFDRFRRVVKSNVNDMISKA